MENTWIVIPAYNEERYIGSVISDVKKYCPNIIVVDDGSRDQTAKISKEVTVLNHIVNMGKGAAARTGCDYAIKKGAERIILIDSDGQHEAKEISLFLEKLKEVDIVFGVRQRAGKMPLLFRFGNKFLNWWTYLLFNIKIEDTQCGYRAFTSTAYKQIRWRSNDYSMETEMIALAGKNKLRYTQIPIKTIYHDKYKGTTVLDGVKIAWKMMKWKVGR